MSDRPRPADVVWTAREAFACAYCWSEFASPETRGDSPEQYWMSITEKARSSCRRVANEKWLLAVARGQAMAITGADMFSAEERASLGASAGIKAEYRITRLISAVRDQARLRYARRMGHD